MITRERLEEALENKNAYQDDKLDHFFAALNCLRNKIPFDVCGRIVQGADHDIVYLCDVDQVLEYLDENDLALLAECNVMIDDDNDCLAKFV